MHKNIIKASIFCPGVAGRAGLPLLFWGPPGGGKTSVIEEVCAEYSMPCETFSLSERGEGAVGAVPVPSSGTDEFAYLATLSARIVELHAGGVAQEEALAQALKETPKTEMVLTYPRPDWTSKFVATGYGVIFVDEITSVPPAIMPALMGLFLAGRIGSFTLPRGVRRLAAANPVEQAAAGYELPMPLANRMGHIDWAMPTVEDHTQYMLRGSSSHAKTSQLLAEMDADAGGDEAPEVVETYDVVGEEKRVAKLWPEAWARAVGLETAFLQAKDMKNQMPAVGSPQAGRAWPSDRSWEMATRAYAASKVHGLSEAEEELFVEAFIGPGAAGEWMTFVRDQDLPNPAKLLDGQETFANDPARPDRTIAVLQSCVALVTPKGAKRRNERCDTLWQLLEKLTADRLGLDLLVPAVHALIETDLHSLKHAAKTLAKINPILKQAGIKPRAR